MLKKEPYTAFVNRTTPEFARVTAEEPVHRQGCLTALLTPCPTSLRPDDNRTMVRTRLHATRVRIGRNGAVTRQSCLSTGVLEERVFRALQRMA